MQRPAASNAPLPPGPHLKPMPRAMVWQVSPHRNMPFGSATTRSPSSSSACVKSCAAEGAEVSTQCAHLHSCPDTGACRGTRQCRAGGWRSDGGGGGGRALLRLACTSSQCRSCSACPSDCAQHPSRLPLLDRDVHCTSAPQPTNQHEYTTKSTTAAMVGRGWGRSEVPGRLTCTSSQYSSCTGSPRNPPCLSCLQHNKQVRLGDGGHMLSVRRVAVVVAAPTAGQPGRQMWRSRLLLCACAHAPQGLSELHRQWLTQPFFTGTHSRSKVGRRAPVHVRHKICLVVQKVADVALHQRGALHLQGAGGSAQTFGGAAQSDERARMHVGMHVGSEVRCPQPPGLCSPTIFPPHKHPPPALSPPRTRSPRGR